MVTPGPSEPTRTNPHYAVDKILRFKVKSLSKSDNEATTIQVKIKKQQRPWTLSCGMIVEIHQAPENFPSLSTGDEVFLKMFDRRFTEQLRDDNGIKPWCEDFEQEFSRGLASGKVEEFLKQLLTVPNFKDDTEEDWDNAENEAYLISELHKYFDSETATYARLQQYQGQVIPRLLASVTLDETTATSRLGLGHEAQMIPHLLASMVLDDTPSIVGFSTQQRKLNEHKGILLQYLPGYSLSEMIDNAPRTSWQGIVDQAIQKVHLFGDHNILNKDVRPANFMVVPKNGTYSVFMIDFGQCRFRRKDETDAEWGRAKWGEDEEGAVALIMRLRLKRVGFKLQYEHSLRYLEWAPGEFDY
jgi:hypothetical protein